MLRLMCQVRQVSGHTRRYFTERLVRACAELPKLCEFFHIPFQSGDNDILREMRWPRQAAPGSAPAPG